MREEENYGHACDEGEVEDCNKKSDESETSLVAFTLIAVLADVIGMFDHHGTDKDGADENVEDSCDVDYMNYVIPGAEGSL